MCDDSPHSSVLLMETRPNEIGRVRQGSLRGIQSPGPPARRRRRNQPAFALLDLLVSIAIIAAFAAMLLPAMARARFRSKVVSCTSIMHQWATVVRMYASDDAKRRLPGFGAIGFGELPTDAGFALLTNLAPYGFNVPMWFCPVRSSEFVAAQTWALSHTPTRTLSSMGDLAAYIGAVGGEGSADAPMRWNYWVVRGTPPGYPVNSFTLPQADAYVASAAGQFGATGNWPVHTTDRAGAIVPFISDLARTSNGGGNTNVSSIDRTTGHFFGAICANLNAAYPDGHTENHPRTSIKSVYNTGGSSYWFY